eukprot:GHVU01028324.1.p1 GENE.GHVU01028324.1~~GHVU01028324.1.p1  ORF type:complete len:184 (+),score=10.54 GHVU01028324.1:215-766(+)
MRACMSACVCMCVRFGLLACWLAVRLPEDRRHLLSNLDRLKREVYTHHHHPLLTASVRSGATGTSNLSHASSNLFGRGPPSSNLSVLEGLRRRFGGAGCRSSGAVGSVAGGGEGSLSVADRLRSLGDKYGNGLLGGGTESYRYPLSNLVRGDDQYYAASTRRAWVAACGTACVDEREPSSICA